MTTPYSGKAAVVKVTGPSAAFSSQALETSDHKTYTITSTALAEYPWDPTATITVLTSSGGTVTGYTPNRLRGAVVFSSSANRGTMKVSGQYRTLSTLANCKEYTLTANSANLDTTYFAYNWNARIQGLKDVSGTLSRWEDLDRFFYSVIESSSEPNPCVIEFYPNSESTSYTLRAWAILNSDEISATVEGAEDETVGWEGAADADLRSLST